jgi:hypothetical protein
MATETARHVVITVPMAPPVALAPNRRGHEHWRYRQQAAKELREAAWLSARNIVVDNMILLDRPLPWTSEGPVVVHEHIVWPKGRRLVDPDSLPGYVKNALDGIVDAGIIAGDSARYVASVTSSQEKGDDTQGRIVITIKEVT